jgi:D-glycero-beta-D-manno-heptose-7-phosphate kinase
VATLALAAGLTPEDAARLANTAAALVVRRLGNAVVSPAELAGALGRNGEAGDGQTWEVSTTSQV